MFKVDSVLYFSVWFHLPVLPVEVTNYPSVYLDFSIKNVNDLPILSDGKPEFNDQVIIY